MFVPGGNLSSETCTVGGERAKQKDDGCMAFEQKDPEESKQRADRSNFT